MINIDNNTKEKIKSAIQLNKEECNKSFDSLITALNSYEGTTCIADFFSETAECRENKLKSVIQSLENIYTNFTASRTLIFDRTDPIMRFVHNATEEDERSSTYHGTFLRKLASVHSDKINEFDALKCIYQVSSEANQAHLKIINDFIADEFSNVVKKHLKSENFSSQHIAIIEWFYVVVNAYMVNMNIMLDSVESKLTYALAEDEAEKSKIAERLDALEKSSSDFKLLFLTISPDKLVNVCKGDGASNLLKAHAIAATTEKDNFKDSKQQAIYKHIITKKGLKAISEITDNPLSQGLGFLPSIKRHFNNTVVADEKAVELIYEPISALLGFNPSLELPTIALLCDSQEFYEESYVNLIYLCLLITFQKTTYALGQ